MRLNQVTIQELIYLNAIFGIWFALMVLAYHRIVLVLFMAPFFVGYAVANHRSKHRLKTLVIYLASFLVFGILYPLATVAQDPISELVKMAFLSGVSALLAFVADEVVP